MENLQDNKKHIITFGCRLNEYESNIIHEKLNTSLQQKYVVINSCSVTQEGIKKR